MQRWIRTALLLGIVALAALVLRPQERPLVPDAPAAADAGATVADRSDPAWLPPEARATLRLIDSGGPYPYDRDGIVFQNREGVLPQRPRGHYREYTVPTPGSRDRGARRIVTGGEPPTEFYYTDDHYRTFRRIEGAQP